jgi:hypothetical protein
MGKTRVARGEWRAMGEGVRRQTAPAAFADGSERLSWQRSVTIPNERARLSATGIRYAYLSVVAPPECGSSRQPAIAC